MNNSDAYGPFQTHEARTFVASVVGAHKDSANHRFDLDAVADELTGRTFDAAEMWQTLEVYRINKHNKGTYAL
jgi:hypothetical protein